MKIATLNRANELKRQIDEVTREINDCDEWLRRVDVVENKAHLRQIIITDVIPADGLKPLVHQLSATLHARLGELLAQFEAL